MKMYICPLKIWINTLNICLSLLNVDKVHVVLHSQHCGYKSFKIGAHPSLIDQCENVLVIDVTVYVFMYVCMLVRKSA